MNKQYSFLAGLPRSGSTLLSSIIAQNPKIHAEGLTHVCELLWRVFESSIKETRDGWQDHVIVGQKQEAIRRVLRAIPDLYYRDVSKPIILDKGRTWTYPDNLQILKMFVTNSPKIVVLVRPLEEVLSSIVRVARENKWSEDNIFKNMLEEDDPIMKLSDGVILARQQNQGEYLFIQYDELVFETEKTLKKIYDFFGWSQFQHNLKHIERPFIQYDQAYNLIGLHDVRKTIEKQKYHVELPGHVLKKCHRMNPLILGK